VRGLPVLLALVPCLVAGAASAAPAQVRVPPGFRVDVFAGGLERPTALAVSPRGRVFATQEGGEVVLVRPGARPRLVARGFRTPLGLAWRGRELFVSAQGKLWRLANGERRAILTGLPYGRHQQDNVVVGRDGRLYLGSGSTCDACAEKSRLSAAILSVRPDGSGLRVVARGLRNPFGLAVQPETGQLFASVNHRDDLGEWEPAETIVRVRAGRHYGWPACWPSWRRKRLVGRCRGVPSPAAYLEPHSSPDGIAFWRGDLYVAEWGEYEGRTHGRKVVRVRLRPGRPGRVSVFATGLDHPLALAVYRGSLLVADWERGVIYRIR
jgi:glucose/arabinose dehydrogenase